MQKQQRNSSSRSVLDDRSANTVARSELMVAIINAIKEKGLTQAQAAEILGVGQPRISDVAQGRVDRFTVDTLMLWLQMLGKDVSVTVRDNVFSTMELVQLTLFVCGSPDERLMENIARLFGGNSNRYSLNVVDVLQNPALAAAQQVSSTPCLIKESPLPRIVLTGDMSAPSVRWQLAVSERVAMDSRQRDQDQREMAQDRRESEIEKREIRLRDKSK